MLGAVGAFVGMSAVAGLLVTAAVTPAIAVTGMAANNSIGVFEGLPEYLEIGQLAQPSTIYASNGYPLANFYSQNRLPVGFDKMSQAVKDAAIAGEDPRFYSHGGVDIQGTVRGVLSTVSGGGVQGGSSITQQYVKNVLLQKCEAMPQKTKEDKASYQQCVVDSTGVSPDRKVKEMKYAIGLEKKYSKDEILQGYLNIAGFGGSVYGIEAAAKYYYNTTAAALTPAQAASLVAIVNEPTSLKIDDPESKTNGKANGYAKNKERRDYILDKMYEYKKLTKAQRAARLRERADRIAKGSKPDKAAAQQKLQAWTDSMAKSLSVSDGDVTSAVHALAKERLDSLVSQGWISSAQETKILARPNLGIAFLKRGL